MNIYHLYFVGTHGRHAVAVADDERGARLRASMFESDGGWEQAHVQKIGEVVGTDTLVYEGVVALERKGNGLR